MKRLTLLSAAMLMAAMVMAMPAKPVKRTIQLSDGSQVEVTLRGDEHFHFYQSDAGDCYREMGDGQFVPISASLVESTWTERAARRSAALLERGARRRAQWGATSNPISGEKRGLVILVNFLKRKMDAKHDKEFYERYFNEEGFSVDGMAGSVHDYFYESSYGKFDLRFDVVGPVTASRDYSYYGKNDERGNDMRICELVIEAVKAADAAGVDFSKYDWDNDGEVDQVFLVYAGYGENQGAAENTIWAHEWDLSSGEYYGDGTGPVTVDGVQVNTYAVSCELSGISGSRVSGIGSACHEFSHCMCIPDFYDTRPNGGNFGMSRWDLMDSGSYEGPMKNGECPTAYSSYERMYCGWLTPTELTEYTEVRDMPCLVDVPQAYIIYNQANRNEFYLLENRQKEGFFASSPGHGMLVLHVDFDEEVWAGNVVNNTTKRQRMTIIPADGSYRENSSNDYAGDTYPGYKKVTSLTNTTNPKASLYNRNTDGQMLLNFPIVNISENNGLISFDAGEKSDAIFSPWQEDARSDAYYDLQGRPVSHPRQGGIYLQQGRKVWMR